MIITAKNMKKIISKNFNKKNKKYIKAVIKDIKDSLMNIEFDAPIYFSIDNLLNVQEIEKYFKKRGFKTSFKDKGFNIYSLKLSWDD